MNENPSLLDQESLFELNEYFISRTDKRGIIQFGNEVFYRVSGYSVEQMVGSPHNIIRHPDMPKTIFKFFWQTIKQNKTIAAYVKNKSIDGKYYWVFATAFPTKDGYLSIRMKPSSELFEKVQILYAKIIQVEDEKGVDAGLLFLVAQLKALGFSSYEEFMSHAMQVELKLKEEFINSKLGSVNKNKNNFLKNTFLDELKARVETTADRSVAIKHSVNYLNNLKKLYLTQDDMISKVCEKLNCLAINMSVSAHKLGKDGTTLAVIANSFQSTTNLISKSYLKFVEDSKIMLSQLSEISFGANCTQIQIEMIIQYLNEADQEIQRSSNKNSLSLVAEETRILLDSVKQIFKQNTRNQNEFYKLLVNLKKNISNIQTQMIRLDLICTGGKLEGSRTNEITEKFKPFLNEMNLLLIEVEQPINDLQKMLHNCTTSFESVLSSILNTDHIIGELKIMIDNYVGYEEEAA